MVPDQAPEAQRCQQVVRQFHWPSAAHGAPGCMVMAAAESLLPSAAARTSSRGKSGT